MFWQRSPPINEETVASDPGRLTLLWLLRKELDDTLLQTMAAYDGGMCKEEYHKALVEILRTGQVPCPLSAAPGEICNLLTCGTFDPATPLTPEQRRPEVMRLFAMWILLNAYARPTTDRMGYDENGDELALLNLAQSSLALGPDYVRASLRFVRWAQSAGPAAHHPVEDLFYRLCLLVLLCVSPDAADIQSAPAAYDSLVAAEQEVRRQILEEPSEYWTPEAAWLFGLYDGSCDGVVKSDSIQRRWVRTAVWAVDRLGASGSGKLDPKLAEFRRRLLEPPSCPSRRKAKPQP
jgi:hypothetical protein